MMNESILLEESKDLKFKEYLPEKHIKYMKTVIAFANGNGGKIIFGISDETHQVVGIKDEEVFRMMDAITNAIADYSEPMIIPDITLQTIDNKTVIVVEVAAGKQRPYYIKSLGIDKGIYIRSAGTSRPVDSYMIKELLLEGANKYFDQQICIDYYITDENISRLCDSIKETAMNNCRTQEEKKAVKDITKNTLLSWGVLIEEEGQLFPTNAFALLSGDNELCSQIQCGIFKETTRSIFIDRREFTGAIQIQMEEAYKYVLSKINLGATINSLYRQDEFELPISSIREIIANAVVHCSYLDPGNIQIALFDDRLEITSHGMLLNGVTIEKKREGYSKIRNRAIANAFAYMKIIEKWGSGIPRIMEEFKNRGLYEPEFIDFDGDFRINLYRKKINAVQEHGRYFHDYGGKTTQAMIKNSEELRDIEKEILLLIFNDSFISSSAISNHLEVSHDRIKYYLRKIKKAGILDREGTSQKGKWIIHL